jgi:hypothetical protein
VAKIFGAMNNAGGSRQILSDMRLHRALSLSSQPLLFSESNMESWLPVLHCGFSWTFLRYLLAMRGRLAVWTWYVCFYYFTGHQGSSILK